MVDELCNLVVDVFALFSLFLRLRGLILLVLFLLLLLGDLGQFLLVLLFLLLDVLLHLVGIFLFLLLNLLGKHLMVIDDILSVVSLAPLAEFDWVLVISYVLCVIVVIKVGARVELKVLVAGLILLLRVDFLHLFIPLVHIIENFICLVLEVSSPQLLFVTSSHVGSSLDKIIVALTLLRRGFGTISLIRVWNIV